MAAELPPKSYSVDIRHFLSFTTPHHYFHLISVVLQGSEGIKSYNLMV